MMVLQVGPDKRRFVLQHVWKTGGSELCRLARANGWKVPPIDSCTLFLNNGWPAEDYDLIGFETGIMGGDVKTDFIPDPTNNNNNDEIEVHNVQWITIVRHPYSRSLSHFYHVWSNNRSDTLTMKDFFRACTGMFCYFLTFYSDQQTRWHCGTWDCSVERILQRKHLMKAVSNLNKIHVVLILEDMNDPNSCTRRQMKHVLNFTKVEVLSDLAKSNRSYSLRSQLQRQPGTRWEEDVLPYLDEHGRHTNSSDWGSGSEVMAELAMHNAMDLQFYGFAQSRCEYLAAQIKPHYLAATIHHQHRSMKESWQTSGSHLYLSIFLCVSIVILLSQLIYHRSKKQRFRRSKKGFHRTI